MLDSKTASKECVGNEKVSADDQKRIELPRLAFTLKETAAILGVSYITAFRLVNRGIIKASSALRTKLISRKEIERFLHDTAK